MPWIKASDKVPKDTMQVVVQLDNRNRDRYAIARYYSESGFIPANVSFQQVETRAYGKVDFVFPVYAWRAIDCLED